MKKIGIIIAFLGVVLIVFGIGVFTFSDKNSDKKENEKIVKERLSSADYDLFYSNIQTAASYFDIYFVSRYDNFKVNSLNNEEKTQFILNILSNYQSPVVTEELVISESSKYFSTFNLYKNSIYSGSNKILYQYQDGKFTYLSSESQNYIVNSELISNDGYTDSWVLKKKIYFIKTTYNDNKYRNSVYKSIDDLKKGKEIYSFVTDVPASQVDDYKKIRKKINTYVYTFKRVQNQYFLDSVKMED